MPKGFQGMGNRRPLPNDSEGRGHRYVSPSYSRGMNETIAAQGGPDNYAAMEDIYGQLGNDSRNPEISGTYGLDPASRQRFDAKSQRMDQLTQQGLELFGDSFYDIMDQVVRMGAEQDMGNQIPLPPHFQGGGMSSSTLPPPDFGNQQPVSTWAESDGDLRALEEYYGYPVHVSNGRPGPNQPIRNGPPAMQMRNLPGSLAQGLPLKKR